ncbi:endonuclease V [archaeon]|nr:endonuclease V [archaeon]
MEETLAQKVLLKDNFGELKRVAGIASAYFDDKVVSGTIAEEHEQVVEQAYSVRDVVFPNLHSFKAFTEGPSMVDAINKLNAKPDLLFVKGNGIMHPVSAGIACYVGVLTDIPTIGIAEKTLVGEYKLPSHERIGKPVISKEKQIGWIVKVGKENLFISPGHKISVETCLEMALSYVKTKKFPEPLALAQEYTEKTKILVEKRAQRA